MAMGRQEVVFPHSWIVKSGDLPANPQRLYLPSKLRNRQHKRKRGCAPDRWWDDQFQQYMYSLGYTPESKDENGDFPSVEHSPGDFESDEIQLPGFTPWTFLNPRDVYFGIKVAF